MHYVLRPFRVTFAYLSRAVCLLAYRNAPNSRRAAPARLTCNAFMAHSQYLYAPHRFTYLILNFLLCFNLFNSMSFSWNLANSLKSISDGRNISLTYVKERRLQCCHVCWGARYPRWIVISNQVDECFTGVVYRWLLLQPLGWRRSAGLLHCWVQVSSFARHSLQSWAI